MRDQYVRDARRQRGLDRHRDLCPTEMPGRDDQLMACDDSEHRLERRRRDRHRPARNARGNELVLNLSPDRLLRRLRPVLTRLVLRVDRRQPHDPRPTPRRDLHGLRVQPTDAGVERDRPEGIDPRHGRAHDRRALGRRHVVRLEHEPREPELGEPARERRGRRSASSRDPARRGRGGRTRHGRAHARAASAQCWTPASSTSSSGTEGVPLMWNEATVFMPHA